MSQMASKTHWNLWWTVTWERSVGRNFQCHHRIRRDRLRLERPNSNLSATVGWRVLGHGRWAFQLSFFDRHQTLSIGHIACAESEFDDYFPVRRFISKLQSFKLRPMPKWYLYASSSSHHTIHRTDLRFAASCRILPPPLVDTSLGKIRSPKATLELIGPAHATANHSSQPCRCSWAADPIAHLYG